MKKISLPLSVIFLFLIGCANLSQPIALFYMKRDSQVISLVIDIAERLASRHNMVAKKNDINTKKAVSTIYGATGNAWLNRFLSITNPTHPEFTVVLNNLNVQVIVYTPPDNTSGEILYEDWRNALDKAGVQYRLELR